MSTTATVQIPYSEFEALQAARREAELKVANLEDQIRTAKIVSSDAAVLALANAALEVVRYAVGSLPPESNVGWPFAALDKIATNLPLMPDAVTDHSELAQTLSIFARECEKHEHRRSVRSLRDVAKPIDLANTSG